MGFTFDQGVEDYWVWSFRGGWGTDNKFGDASNGVTPPVGIEFLPRATYFKPYKFPTMNPADSNEVQQNKVALKEVLTAPNTGKAGIWYNPAGGIVELHMMRNIVTDTPVVLGTMECVPHDGVDKYTPNGKAPSYIQVPVGIVFRVTGTPGEEKQIMKTGQVANTDWYANQHIFTSYLSVDNTNMNITYGIPNTWSSAWFTYSHARATSGTVPQCMVWQLSHDGSNNWKLWVFSTLFTSTYPSTNSHTDGIEYFPPALTTVQFNDYISLYSASRQCFLTGMSKATVQSVIREISFGDILVTRPELKALFNSMKLRNGIA
jgi:hypothetical protein